ncbi:MAG TPA: glutaredoxin family protein [Candidatus Dormibacteraeota bacterium]|nr:glutaredoxin family protein [Candidatus Dormibacteraeota bacterium]
MFPYGRYAPYGVARAPAVAPVTVYGTSWCAASQMVRRHLERLGVPYRYVDLERDPSAAARLRWLTGGYASHPTVDVAGEVLVEPTLEELDWALSRVGLY